MTLLAAREFAGRGIRVNTIVAGGFEAHPVTAQRNNTK
jgi:NAD(P)-dependent dehydrogenase (short-subunit alcohol dehydrogenase family)